MNNITPQKKDRGLEALLVSVTLFALVMAIELFLYGILGIMERDTFMRFELYTACVGIFLSLFLFLFFSRNG